MSNPPRIWARWESENKGITMEKGEGLTEEERRNLGESMKRHRAALKRLSGDHTCEMRYKGIREVLGHPVEMWECMICGRESIIPYSGTQDTIEWRD